MSIKRTDFGGELQKEPCYNSGRPSPVIKLRAIPIGVDQFKVQWNAPRQINGILLGYKLTYREGNNNPTVVNSATAPRVRELCLIMTNYTLQ